MFLKTAQATAISVFAFCVDRNVLKFPSHVVRQGTFKQEETKKHTPQLVFFLFSFFFDKKVYPEAPLINIFTLTMDPMM